MKKIILINGTVAFAALCLILVSSKNALIAAEIDESKIKYVAAKSGLNLRSEPGKASKIVTLMPFGSKVTIEKSEGSEIFLDGRYGRWVNVKHAGKTGWVFSGFLCDFEPNTIIKPAADFYRDKYRKITWFEDYGWPLADRKKLTDFKDDKVYIDNIIDNYIVLGIPDTSEGGPSSGNVVWRYDVKQGKFFEAHSAEIAINLLYFNNDKYPDLIVQHGHDGLARNVYFLGSENGFVEVVDIETRGTVISTDIKNMSIIIQDSKGLKDRSLFVITDKIYVTDVWREYFPPEKYIEFLQKLKKGDDVSFRYATIDGKKTILSIWKND